MKKLLKEFAENQTKLVLQEMDKGSQITDHYITQNRVEGELIEGAVKEFMVAWDTTEWMSVNSIGTTW